MMAQKLSLLLVVESVFIDLYITCLTVIQQQVCFAGCNCFPPFYFIVEKYLKITPVNYQLTCWEPCMDGGNDENAMHLV